MRRVGELTVIILVILVAGLVVSVSAQKGKPGPPPPAPAPEEFLLDPGLNIVTSEVGSRLRTWMKGENDFYTVESTQNDVVIRAFALGDVNDDGLTELVVPAECNAGTKQRPVYRVYLKAYVQGRAGVAYSGNCTSQSVQVPYVLSSQTQTMAADLDGDGQDEIVLGSNRHIIVFHFQATAAGQPLMVDHTYSSFDFASLGIEVPPGEVIDRRSLAIGDADNDRELEIACALFYRSGSGQTLDQKDRAYLLLFDGGTLALKGHRNLTSEDNSPSGLTSYSIHFHDGLAIADTDGNGRNEIWTSGWENRLDAAVVYKQHVRAWTANGYGGADGKELDLTSVYSWDDDTTRLGPYIAAGELLGDGKDQIILTGLDDTYTADVWGDTGSGLVKLATYGPTEASLQEATVIGNRLFLAGTIPYVSRAQPAGVFLNELQLTRVSADLFDLALIGHNEYTRDGYELWIYTVGYGTK